jgi:hypothetical protein
VNKPAVVLGKLRSLPSSKVLFYLVGSKPRGEPGPEQCFAGVDHLRPHLSRSFAIHRRR